MKKQTNPAPKSKATIQPITGTPTKDYEKLEAVAAGKLDLTNLSNEERAFLGTCQDIYRNDRGCDTPFEEFFCDIARWAMWGNVPTPKGVREKLADFDESWELTLHSVERFVRNYPDMIADFQSAAKSEAWQQPAEAAAHA